MNNISAISNCTACFACVDSCPKHCISVGNNAFLEETLQVEERACIHCGQCLNVCQAHTQSETLLNKPTKCYAVQSKEPASVRIRHSSGGLVSELGRYILSCGGLVAATVWGQNHKAKFVLVGSEAELRQTAGSKYVHSDASGIYAQIATKLKSNIPILFVGLPCQVAGIRRYMSCFVHEEKRALLYTVDLVCHGTPPAAYLQAYLAEYIGLEQMDDIQFRGERDFFLSLLEKGKYIYSVPADRDVYFRAFLDGTIYRKNCYQCRYARPERVGDLTAGDFWGLDRGETMNDFQGRVSLCLVNTTQGRELFEHIKNGVHFEERPYKEALSENKQLTAPMPKRPETNVFQNNCKELGFVKAIKKTGSYALVKKNIRLQKHRNAIIFLKKKLRME